MAVAALVRPDRLDKPSLVLAGQPETEVRERRRLPSPHQGEEAAARRRVSPGPVMKIALRALVRCNLNLVVVVLPAGSAAGLAAS